MSLVCNILSLIQRISYEAFHWKCGDCFVQVVGDVLRSQMLMVCCVTINKNF